MSQEPNSLGLVDVPDALATVDPPDDEAVSQDPEPDLDPEYADDEGVE